MGDLRGRTHGRRRLGVSTGLKGRRQRCAEVLAAHVEHAEYELSALGGAGLSFEAEEIHETRAERPDRCRSDLDEKRPATQPSSDGSDGRRALTQAEEEEGEHDVVRLAPGEPMCLVDLCHEYTDTGAFEVEKVEGWGGQRGRARRRVSAAATWWGGETQHGGVYVLRTAVSAQSAWVQGQSNQGAVIAPPAGVRVCGRCERACEV